MWIEYQDHWTDFCWKCEFITTSTDIWWIAILKWIVCFSETDLFGDNLIGDNLIIKFCDNLIASLITAVIHYQNSNQLLLLTDNNAIQYRNPDDDSFESFELYNLFSPMHKRCVSILSINFIITLASEICHLFGFNYVFMRNCSSERRNQFHYAHDYASDVVAEPAASYCVE